MRFPFCLLPAAYCLLILGCSTNEGPDANPHVFETPEQAATKRRQKLLVEWQEMALRIANAERPDTKFIKAEGFSIQASADGATRTMDLTPIMEKLQTASGREREPIREFLAMEMVPFDRERMKAMGFEKAKPMLRPWLANTKQTSGVPGTPVVNKVVIDLNWLPVVRWGADAQTAVDTEVARAWNVPAEQINAAALENLKMEFAAISGVPFDSTDLPGMGRYGSLKSEVDPSVILLPEFLASVRKTWNTTDDIVIFMPARTSVTFLERKNEKLLNQMQPEWVKLHAKVAEPMIATMLLAGDKGLSLLSYAPATKPTTVPATKPVTRPYIVR